MTTNVHIKNADTSHREIVVKVGSNPDLTLQPGQDTTQVVYSGQDISISEGGVDEKADEAHNASEAEKAAEPAAESETGSDAGTDKAAE